MESRDPIIDNSLEDAQTHTFPTEYIKFEGILFPFSCTEEKVKFCRDEFVVKDTDVIVMSYPKSGTNWIIEVISLIRCKGDNAWVHSVPIWERSPWIESPDGLKNLGRQDGNGTRFYTSHLPIQLFPKSYKNSQAKIIYIMRNPRDVVVSYYYFSQWIKYLRPVESFTHMLEMFSQGNVPFGSWFDHTCGWLSFRENGNFLMLTYEELQQDLRGNVVKICEFLGTKLNEEELRSVLKNASFSAMKNNKMSNYSVKSNQLINCSKGLLTRKGISGDWKNHFTVAQSEAFDNLFQEKMAQVDQKLFIWEQ